jgi:RHS repeat-associated protein
VGALTEMYVQGVSTRKVKAITEELCGHEVSASTISRLNQGLDQELEKFARRRLEELYPYLILDARYEKVREDGVIRSLAVLVAIGVDWEGRRNVPAVELANRESQSSRKEFGLGLRQRGLRGVELVISDDHAGLRAAIEEVFPEAAWHKVRILPEEPNSVFPNSPVRTVYSTEKFTGYFRDSESGNDYAVNRYESPGYGRFLTPDRMSGHPSDPGSWNKYAYTRGDPVNRVDSAGTDDDDPDCIGDICLLIDTPGYGDDGYTNIPGCGTVSDSMVNPGVYVGCMEAALSGCVPIVRMRNPPAWKASRVPNRVRPAERVNRPRFQIETARGRPVITREHGPR